MDTRKNAPLTPKGREAMVRSVIEGGLTKAAAALQFHVSAKTVADTRKNAPLTPKGREAMVRA
jgi:transposase-like protein